MPAAIATDKRPSSMANTLYDLLEVNQTASAETIAANYRRLHAKSAEQAANGDQDATNLLIALREAFSTLSDPQRRQRYDARLQEREAREVVYVDSGSSGSLVKWLIFGAIFAACAIGTAKFRAEQEKARMEAEQAAAAAKIAEIEAEKEIREKRAAEQAEYQRRRDEAAERAARERDLAYANQVSRNIQQAENQARWEQQREQQREQQQKAIAERQQQYDAEHQLAREKAYLRKIESENRYPRY
ncbi:MAG: hypothetical protein D3M94_05295 [Rhodocyclales bacterium GT-UBC]|nr:MAG: hypothetical protein D3M94_05295 [Rhodocyclales bacterium GT-UBC]